MDSLDLDNLPLPAARRSPRKRNSPSSSGAASSRKSPRKQAQPQHDPTVRAKSTAALEQARKAREALKAAQSYKAKEVELPPEPPQAATMSSYKSRRDVEVLDVDDAPAMASASIAVASPPAISYNGPVIKLTLRYNNPQTSKEAKSNLKIKMDQPLQHLLDEFKSTQSGLEITSINFDGQRLNVSKTPAFYDMEDEAMTVLFVLNGPFNFKHPTDWNIDNLVNCRKRPAISPSDDQENGTPNSEAAEVARTVPRKKARKSRPSAAKEQEVEA